MATPSAPSVTCAPLGPQDVLLALLGHADDVIYVRDLDGRFVLTNPSFQALVGQTEQQLHGRTVEELYR